MWKGLAASTGDLVVFVDADIVDIGPRFVTGLLGPLLHDPDIRYTKACYDRPLRVARSSSRPAGGRVTELLARPVLGAFWPELAWLAQPLSGEYAGRRELFSSLPFVRGYGVELGCSSTSWSGLRGRRSRRSTSGGASTITSRWRARPDGRRDSSTSRSTGCPDRAGSCSPTPWR
jgi:hypothetical protein